MPHGEGTYYRYDEEYKMNVSEAGFLLEDGKAGLCKYFKISPDHIFRENYPRRWLCDH